MATEGAATLRRVVAGTDFGWDGGAQHLAEGTVIWVEPGSYLEACIGPENLADVSGDELAGAALHAGVSN